MMGYRTPSQVASRQETLGPRGLLLLLAALACSAGRAVSQEEPIPPLPPPPTIGGFAPRLPFPPQPAPAPAAGFVEGLSATSSVIEIKAGQGRFLTLKRDIAVPGKPAPFLAVGDPSVVDFIQIGPRQLRLIGKRLGTTDLMITTSLGEVFEYEVQVVADLDVLRAQLRQMFPEAGLKLSQLREKIVVEGQARDAAQVSRILSTIDTYIRSAQRIQVVGQVADQQNLIVDPNAPPPAPRPAGAPGMAPPLVADPTALQAGTAAAFGQGAGVAGGVGVPATAGAVTTNQLATNQVQIINLMRVPSSQQVLLKVRVAEMNRTSMREIGADFLAEIPQFGSLFGTQIAGNAFTQGSSGVVGNAAALPGATVRGLGLGSQATVFGTFSRGQFNTVINALRKNNIVKILAEPNLMALNGHQASFLAGGEFPVPSFSGVGSGGASGGGSSSTQFKEFGVRLAFLPIILDNETVRLTVDPEVSSIDFSIATTLVPGGSPVPGLSTRKQHTTVELKQGETLAIAGLMQLELDGATQKIPGLGDLPYIGTFFSNTTNNRMEKELIVLITPYLVEPMQPGQVPPVPGDEVKEPNDLEFFFLNRIESRTGVDARSTVKYDDPFHLIRHSLVERKYLIGPSGFSK